jgi:hypothetical protein
MSQQRSGRRRSSYGIVYIILQVSNVQSNHRIAVTKSFETLHHDDFLAIYTIGSSSVL